MPEVKANVEYGESYVVASFEFWEGMVRVCRDLAKQYEQHEAEYKTWIEIAKDLELQVLEHIVTDEWEEWYEDDDD